MAKHRVVGGVVVTTPEGVFAHYRPAAHLVSPEVWGIVRPVAIDACRAADYKSVASALQCLSAVTYFLAGRITRTLPWTWRRSSSLRTSSATARPL